MHFRDSGIIYGPFWGSFAVVDELRYCTVHLGFISTHNQTKMLQKLINRSSNETKEISLEFSVDIKEDHVGFTTVLKNKTRGFFNKW